MTQRTPSPFLLVACERCRRTDRVDAGHCVVYGWPRCCGVTMVDKPGRFPDYTDDARDAEAA